MKKWKSRLYIEPAEFFWCFGFEVSGGQAALERWNGGTAEKFVLMVGSVFAQIGLPYWGALRVGESKKKKTRKHDDKVQRLIERVCGCGLEVMFLFVFMCIHME